MLKKHSLLTCASALCLAASPALAQEDVSVDFSGFASVVFGQTFSDEKEGQVYDIPTDLDLNGFNRLGLRLDADLQHKLSFTTQFIAFGSSDYEPKVDWLNVSYHFTPEISITAGRSRIPFYFFSSVVDVGYAYVWITAPEAVYQTEALRSVDGLTFRYTADMADDWTSDLSLWAGQTKQQLEEVGNRDYTVEDLVGFAWSVNHEWLTLRATYATGLSNFDISGILDVPFTTPDGAPNDLLGANLDPTNEHTISSLRAAFAYLAAQGIDNDFSSVVEDITIKDKRTHWYSFGLMMEFDEVFIISEYSKLLIEDVLSYGNNDAVYATVGFNLPADLTLAFTYSYDNKQGDEAAINAFDKIASAAPQTAQAQTVVGGTKAYLRGFEQGGSSQQNTFNITGRWNFHPQAALKMEYQLQDRRLFTNEMQHPQSLRAAVDIIF
ncbi:Uncharacterised protein [BD1-7 clade bacterium]|uniref:Porin domain-containing protein n=1 Tax=BD1-7 clade bacterium TaxID=2029982 RepID=A0A5S9QNV5_9GAMM|nr:Uncharacterised protein [BD1-7 clade bacterium]